MPKCTIDDFLFLKQPKALMKRTTPRVEKRLIWADFEIRSLLDLAQLLDCFEKEIKEDV